MSATRRWWWSCLAAVWLGGSGLALGAPAKLSAKPVKAVELGGEVQLEVTASGAAADEPLTYRVEGDGNGTIDPHGLFRAPTAHATPAKVTVIATGGGETHPELALTVPLAAISVSAKAEQATLPLGGETQLSAVVKGATGDAAGVKFELTGQGVIDEKGHYTAPKTGKTPSKATVKVSSVADPSKATTVTLNLAAISLSAKASSASVTLGGTSSIDVKVSGATGEATGVRFEVLGENAGTVDDKGVYTAPASGKTPARITVRATSVADPGKSAKVELALQAVSVAAKVQHPNVTLGQSVQVEPTVKGVAPEAAQVRYELRGPGSIDEKGLYTAPKSAKTPDKATITVTSVADPGKSAKVELALAAVSVTAKSEAATVPLGGTTTVDAQVGNVAAELGGVRFELSGDGAIDDKGLYTAPKSGKTPGKVTVKASSIADPTKSATVAIGLAPISVSAKAQAATVPLGGETSLDATLTGATGDAAGLKFELTGEGQVDDKGHYLAPAAGKTPLKATIKVSSVADPSKVASVALSVAEVSVSAKPPAKAVPVGGAAELAATVRGAVEAAGGVHWSVIGEGHGTIDDKGHFTAPASFKTPGTVSVKATSSADPSKSTTIAIPIAAVSVSISPKQPSLELGSDQVFAAQVLGADSAAQQVTWAVEGGDKNGTIDATGHYRSPAHLTTPAKLTVRATPAADPSRSSAVTLSIAAIKVAAHAPKGVMLGGTAKVEAQVTGATGSATGVSWKVETANGGTIDPDGTYHAPEHLKTPATIAVRVTSDADPGKSASTSIALPAVAVSLPAKSFTTELGDALQLGATVTGATGNASGVSWSVEGKEQGAIDEKGRYVPPGKLKTPATITVRSTSSADPTKTATAQVNVQAISIAVEPASAEVALGSTASFKAQVNGAVGEAQKVSWSVVTAEGGTIEADGTYHAPSHAKTPAKVRIRATVIADPSKTAEAEVTWPAVGIALSPGTGRAALGETLAFKASVDHAADTGFELSVDGSAGTIAQDGTFTAATLLPEPPVAKIVARSKADPGKTATALVDLTVASTYSVASEQRISGGAPGSILAGPSSRQRLVLDDKRVIAVYNDGQALLLPVSEDRGASFRAPLKLLSGKFPIAAPQLALAPDHTLWVAFRAQSKGQPGDVVVCRTPDLQHGFDPCVKANGKAGIANLLEHALAVGPGGSVLVAWHDGAHVTLARSSNRGASFSTQSFDAPSAHGLALAVAPDGTAFLAFAIHADGTDKLVLLAGNDALAPMPGFTASGEHLDEPSLVARSASSVAIAYADTGRIQLAVVGGASSSVGGETGVTLDLPVLALDGDGLQLAFRERRSEGESMVLVRARNAFLGKLQLEPGMVAGTGGPATRGAPSLVVDRAGRGLIAWTDGRAGDAQGQHQDLYLARADEHPAQVKVTAPGKPLLAGQSAQLAAEVTGAASKEVRWVVDDGAGRGSVDSSGLYTAPTRLTGSPHVYVRAISVADPTRSAAALIELAPQPELASFSPESCGLGEVVTLSGSHFGARYPGYGVTFGGVRARDTDFVSWTDDAIRVRLPPGAKSGPVEVTAAGGTTRAARAFTFLPVAMTIQPAFAVLHQSERRAFSATVLHAGDTRVTWRLDDPQAGQLSPDGTLSVEAHPEKVHRTSLRAVSAADPDQSTSASLITGPLGGKVWSASATGAHGPALASGLAVITDRDGHARAFDREGLQVWSTEVVQAAGSEGAPPQLRSPIVVEGLVVVVVQNSGSCAEGRACLPDTGELLALELHTGRVAWRTELGEGDFTDPVAFGGAVAVARYAGALSAFKTTDGKKLWTVALPKGLSTPPVPGADGDLHGTGDGGVLYAVSSAGKLLGQTTIPGKPSSVSRPAVAANGTVYVAAEDGKLRAIDARGQVVWTAPLGGRVPPRTDSAPLLGEDTVYVATATTLEAFDLSGTRRWKSSCGACSAPILQAADGTLYAGRYAPQAFARDGAFQWSADATTEGERWSPGAITDEGLLFWTDARGLSTRIAAPKPPPTAAPPAAQPTTIKKVSAR